MNRTPHTSRSARPRRVLAAAAFSAALVALSAPAIAHAQDDDGKNDKVSICHQNGNGSYVLITVGSGGADNGHAKHEGDVPPAADGTCPAPATPATPAMPANPGNPANPANPATPSKTGKVFVCHLTGNGGYTIINIALAGWDNGHSKHEGDILLLEGAGTTSCDDAATTLAGTLAGTPGVTGVDVASLVPAVADNSAAPNMVTVCHLTSEDGYVKITVPQAAWDTTYSTHNGDILLNGTTRTASCIDALITLGAAIDGSPNTTGIDAASLTPALPTATATPAAPTPLPVTGIDNTILMIAGALAVAAGMSCLQIGNKRTRSALDG